jgi:hypothetical protein
MVGILIPLQKWNLISLKLKIFTWNIEKTKIINKILVNLSKYEVKILIFKEIKSHFCRGLKIQPYPTIILKTFKIIS